MSLLKNEVGRPSNELKTKRRMLLFVVILISVAFFGTIGYIMYSNIKEEVVEGISKNVATTDASLIGKEFAVSVYPSSDKNFSGYVVKCPSGYKIRSDGNCTKANTTTKFFSFSYRGNVTLARANASSKCNENGYSSYKNFNYNKTLNRVSFTCYDVIKKSASLYVVRYYNQREVNSTINSACGGGVKKLSAGGCLPSASAMVFSTLKDSSYTPTTINSKAKTLINNSRNKSSLTSNKYCKTTGDCYSSAGNKICSSSSYYVQLVNELSKSYGLNYYDVSNSSTADSYLKSGKCMGIAALRSNCSLRGCYSVGHFVSFFPSERSGYAHLSDPWNRNNKAVETSIRSIINSTQSGYVKIVCKR